MSSYSQEFKDEVIARVLSSNESVADIAVKFNVSKYSVYQWLKQYEIEHLPATMGVMVENGTHYLDDDPFYKDPRYLALVAENKEMVAKLAAKTLSEGRALEEVNFLKKVSRYFAHKDL